MHINEQPDIHSENFRALAFTVLAGEATRRKKLKKTPQGSKIRTGPLYYSIVGTVKKKKLFSVKERHSWIKEIDGLYYCQVCTVHPTILRTLRASNKEEYFINKGVQNT